MPGSARPWLAKLLEPFEADTFLDRCWPHSSVASHSSLDRFPELASATGLRNLPRLLTSIEGSVRVWSMDSSGHFRDEPMSTESALARYEAGAATVVVDSLESRSDYTFLRELMEGLARDLGTPQNAIACNAYASRSGTRTALHFDEQEVFLLQIRGRKRWQIAPNREVPFPTDHYNVGSPELKDELLLLADHPLAAPTIQEEILLEPGSVLFLPRGYWHQGEALSDSLGLTLTFHSSSWLDLVLKALRRRLLRQEALRRPANGVLDHGGREKDARKRAAKAVRAAAQAVRGLSPNEVLAPRFNTLDASRRFSWAPSVQDVSASAATIPGRHLLAVRRIALPDLQLELPARLAPLARWLAERTDPFTLFNAFDPFMELPREEVAALIGLLLREEVLAGARATD